MKYLLLVLLCFFGCTPQPEPPIIPQFESRLTMERTEYRKKELEFQHNYPRPYVGQPYEDFVRRWGKWLAITQHTEIGNTDIKTFQVWTTGFSITLTIDHGVITAVSN